MKSSVLQRLVLAGATALLVAGVAGAAVHDDDSTGSATAGLDDPNSPSVSTTPAGTSGDATGSGGSTSAPPTSPAEPTAPPPEPSAPPGEPGVGAASTPAGEPSAGTAGSGLAATGVGEVASGTAPLADTGSYPMAPWAAVLLALAGAGRALLRSSAPRPS